MQGVVEVSPRRVPIGPGGHRHSRRRSLLRGAAVIGLLALALAVLVLALVGLMFLTLLPASM